MTHAAVKYPGSWKNGNVSNLSELLLPKLSDDKKPQGFPTIGYSVFVVYSIGAREKIILNSTSN